MSPQVIEFLTGALQPDDYALNGNTGQISGWKHGAAQPTEQQIADAEADRTTVNGQVFSQWLAEHGGNAAATLRREAREALSAARAESALHRAALLVIVDEFNRHTEKFTALRNAIANANSLAEVKTAAAAIDPIPVRTGQDLRNAAEGKINAGAADS